MEGMPGLEVVIEIGGEQVTGREGEGKNEVVL